MDCGYYCVRYDCYIGEVAEPEFLIRSRVLKQYFNADPVHDYYMWNEFTESVIHRTILSGPFPTVSFANQFCGPPEPSDSGSASFSGSDSVSSSGSASDSESGSIPPVNPECGGTSCDSCCFTVVDLDELDFGGSPNVEYSDFPSGSNTLSKIQEGIVGIWQGTYTLGPYQYTLIMYRVYGPVEYSGVIYGEDGGPVYTLSIQSLGEFSSHDWAGVAEDCPLAEWTALTDPSFHGPIDMVACASGSGSASFSV